MAFSALAEAIPWRQPKTSEIVIPRVVAAKPKAYLSADDLRELESLDGYLTEAQFQFVSEGKPYSVVYVRNEPGIDKPCLFVLSGSYSEHHRDISELIAQETGGIHMPPGTIILGKKVTILGRTFRVLGRELTTTMIADYIERWNNGNTAVVSRFSNKEVRLDGAQVSSAVYKNVPQSFYDAQNLPKGTILRVQ